MVSQLISQISICVSKKGSVDSELTLEWIKAFDEATKPDDPDEWRQLVVDNHKTHTTYQVLAYAKSQKIDVADYPPHSTHVLQGLDVTCFSPFKTYVSKMKKQYQREYGRPMNKKAILRHIKQPFDRAFCYKNIKSAFVTTGLEPIDRTRVPREALGGSEGSTWGPSFGLAQPEEVLAVLPLIEHAYRKAGEQSQDMEHEHKPDKCSTRQSAEPDAIQDSDLTPRARQLRQQARAQLERTSMRWIFHQQEQTYPDHWLSPPQTPVIPKHPDTPPSLQRYLDRSPIEVTTLEEALLDNQAMHAANVRLRACLAQAKKQAQQTSATLVIQNLHLKAQARRFRELATSTRQRSRVNRLLASKLGRHLTGDVFLRAALEDDRNRHQKSQKKKFGALKKKLSQKKLKWRKQEQDQRKRLQDQALAEWEEAKEFAREQGDRLPKKPRIRVLFPKASTPDRFQWKSPENITGDPEQDAIDGNGGSDGSDSSADESGDEETL